ncbi:ClpX C4-type zinc finger protein [Marinobacteraceae bacterium S3BR75-40.1]
MADSDIDQELKALLEQLSDDDLNAITRKLGLDQHNRPRRSERKRTAAVVKAEDEGKAVCSFCGQDAQAVGMMISNRNGDFICRGCLAKFRQE